MMVFIDDVAPHAIQARAAGARIVSEPSVVDFGPESWSNEGYECVDLGGHHWWS
jgi:hypothetical protein